MMTNTVCLTLEEYNKLYEAQLRAAQLEDDLRDAYGNIGDLAVDKARLQEELAKAQEELEKQTKECTSWYQRWRTVSDKLDEIEKGGDISE